TFFHSLGAVTADAAKLIILIAKSRRDSAAQPRGEWVKNADGCIVGRVSHQDRTLHPTANHDFAEKARVCRVGVVKIGGETVVRKRGLEQRHTLDFWRGRSHGCRTNQSAAKRMADEIDALHGGRDPVEQLGHTLTHSACARLHFVISEVVKKAGSTCL